MSLPRTPRAAALHRIATLYSVVEDMHAVSLRLASASVDEAEQSIQAGRIALAATGNAARNALTTGDREESLFAQSQTEIFTARAVRLESLKAQRLAAESTARADFLASRLKTEQMKQLVAHIAEQATLEESRRSQSLSDDRYAARRAWLSGRSLQRDPQQLRTR